VDSEQGPDMIRVETSSPNLSSYKEERDERLCNETLKYVISAEAGT